MSTPAITVHHLQVGQGERILWLLEELNVPYEIKLYQRSPVLAPPELAAIHPMGASPVIEDTTDKENPILLAESLAIADYLIHKHGNGRLAFPPTHPNYADYLYWSHFSNGGLQPVLFRRALVRSMTTGEDDPRYQGANFRALRALKHFESRLANNKYLAGDEFTAADIMSVWCLTTMRKFESVDITDYPGVQRWLKECTERPGYRISKEKGDPDLKIEELISLKGPELFAGFLKPPTTGTK